MWYSSNWFRYFVVSRKSVHFVRGGQPREQFPLKIEIEQKFEATIARVDNFNSFFIEGLCNIGFGTASVNSRSAKGALGCSPRFKVHLAGTTWQRVLFGNLQLV